MKERQWYVRIVMFCTQSSLPSPTETCNNLYLSDWTRQTTTYRYWKIFCAQRALHGFKRFSLNIVFVFCRWYDCVRRRRGEHGRTCAWRCWASSSWWAPNSAVSCSLCAFRYVSLELFIFIILLVVSVNDSCLVFGAVFPKDLLDRIGSFLTKGPILSSDNKC